MKVTAACPIGASEGSDLFCFNRYLRSNLYPEGDASFTSIKFDEAQNFFYDDDFCTLFVAFCSDTAREFLKSENPSVKKMIVEYGKPYDPPRNTLVLCPDFDASVYRRIVLLDTPLTKGYISHLNKKTNAEIFVVTDHYPYTALFSSLDLSRDGVYDTYESVRRFVFSGNAATGPVDLSEKIEPGDQIGFLARFYALFESGSLAVGQGFALYPQAFSEPTGSTLYRRIAALLRQ